MSHSNATPVPYRAAVTCFSVQTDAEPTTLARVLEVFALREVMPSRFHSVLDPVPANDTIPSRLSVDIQVAGLAPDAAEAIARKLSAVVGVRSVLTAERARPGSA
jgi:hypothetical protein